jgi:hypothetical protein
MVFNIGSTPVDVEVDGGHQFNIGRCSTSAGSQLQTSVRRRSMSSDVYHSCLHRPQLMRRIQRIGPGGGGYLSQLMLSPHISAASSCAYTAPTCHVVLLFAGCIVLLFVPSDNVQGLLVHCRLSCLHNYRAPGPPAFFTHVQSVGSLLSANCAAVCCNPLLQMAGLASVQTFHQWLQQRGP